MGAGTTPAAAPLALETSRTLPSHAHAPNTPFTTHTHAPSCLQVCLSAPATRLAWAIHDNYQHGQVLWAGASGLGPTVAEAAATNPSRGAITWRFGGNLVLGAQKQPQTGRNTPCVDARHHAALILNRC